MTALKTVLAKLSKDTGKAITLGNTYGNTEFFPTGSASLDCFIGRGGWPIGKIIEILGEPGSLKTSVAMTAIKAYQDYAQKNGINKYCAFVDLEYSAEEQFILNFKVDLEKVIWQRFSTLEEAGDFILEIVKTGEIGLIVVDSVDAMQTEAETEKTTGDMMVGGMTKVLSKLIRLLTKLVGDTNTTVIFINQIRMNPGVKFGDPRTSAGGKSIPFYARLRLEFLKRKDDNKDVLGASTLRFKIPKTSFGPPKKDEYEIPFWPGYGFDTIGDLMSLARQLGCLANSGGQTKVLWTIDQEKPEVIHPEVGKGKEACYKLLSDNPDLAERLRQTCLAFSQHQNQASLTELPSEE